MQILPIASQLQVLCSVLTCLTAVDLQSTISSRCNRLCNRLHLLPVRIFSTSCRRRPEVPCSIGTTLTRNDSKAFENYSIIIRSSDLSSLRIPMTLLDVTGCCNLMYWKPRRARGTQYEQRMKLRLTVDMRCSPASLSTFDWAGWELEGTPPIVMRLLTILTSQTSSN